MKLTFYKILEWLAWRYENFADWVDIKARGWWEHAHYCANRATEKRERLEK